VRAFLRGATNLYLPVTTSVISIPPYTDELNVLLQERLGEIKRAWEMAILYSASQGFPDPKPEPFARLHLKQMRQEGFDVDGEFSDTDCVARIADLIGTHSPSQPRSTEQGRPFVECDALRRGNVDPRGEFDAHPINVPAHWRQFIDTIVQVKRLRVVTALRGFCRIARGGPETENLVQGNYAALSTMPKKWLPAIELRGEGIFIELNLANVRKWEDEECVQVRWAHLLRTFNQVANGEGWIGAQCPSPRFVLVHTFAHLLIRQLTLECGYSSASLQERLYVASEKQAVKHGSEGTGEMAGCLIFTSTTDSDGSYGGLVRMGQPTRLGPVLRNALCTAAWCSSDPVCATTPGQGYKGLNLAACHACSLVPETTCTASNTYLDRMLVVPTQGVASSYAFFPQGAAHL
jgi:Domain of unknown function (DUF1998)